MIENTTIDFTEDLKTGDINRIVNKAREMHHLEISIRKQEEKLNGLKESYRYIQNEELPSIMEEETAADELPFDNGYKLKLKPVVAGSIPSESAIKKCKEYDKKNELIHRRSEAFKWLEENNAESIIANKLLISIPKSETGKEKVQKIMDLAQELTLEAYREKSIHPQTLNAYLKEQINMENGKEIPYDTFAIFVGKKAIIEAPKK